MSETTPLKMTTRQMAVRLWREYLRHYSGRLGFAFVLMLGLSLVNVAFPAAINWIFEGLGHTPEGSEISAESAPTVQQVMVWGPVMLTAVGFLLAGLQYLYTLTTNAVAVHVLRDLQRDMFASFLELDFAQSREDGAGQLVSRFTNDTTILRESLLRSPNAVRDLMMLIGLIGYLLYMDWVLFLAVILIYPTVGLPITWLGKYLRRIAQAVQSQIGDMTSQLTESMRGTRMVKTYNLEGYENERAQASFEKRRSLLMKAVRSRSANEPLITAVGAIAIAFVVGIAAWRISQGMLSVANLVSFITAMLLLSAPARSLGTINAVLQEGFAALERIFDVMNRTAEITDKPGASSLTIPARNEAAICFDDVTFTYGPQTPALSNFVLDVPAGKTIALVGESGAGKSTVFNLLPRLYEVTSGRVLINNQDIRDVTLHSLRTQLAIVTQDAILFDDTVAQNIRFGRPEATLAEIETAAQAAAAHEFITALPEGYDTRVGDSGSNLSGGQRQRVALARAFLKDAPILLLDEATSALDAESEQKIQSALEALAKDRTTIVIAHRLATVRKADLICVMDNGRIAEQGTHDELIAKGGIYARLSALQFSEPVNNHSEP